MKKNLFLRLCLMVGLLLMATSCREELLQTEQEHGLQSQKILVQHLKYDELLKKAPLVIRNLKKMTKVSNAGESTQRQFLVEDSAYINTDLSVYIEDEWGNKTFTFKIERTSKTLSEAFLENLVLKDIGDGKYEMYMATYDQTAAENRAVISPEELKNHISFTYLGTEVHSEIFGKYLPDPCILTTSTYQNEVFVAGSNCYGDGNGNHSYGENCNCGTSIALNCHPPVAPHYEIVTSFEDTNVCLAPGGSGNTSGSSGSTGNHGTGGGTTLPITIIHAIGQNVGLMKIPCEKIQELFGETHFLEKFNEMTQSTVFNLYHEKVYAVKYPVANTANTNPEYIVADLPDCASEGSSSFIDDPLVYGVMHDHQDESCDPKDLPPGKFPSVIDIRTFINTLMPRALANTGSYGDAYSLITTSGGSYMLMFSGGNYPGTINPTQYLSLKEEYKEILIRVYNKPNYTQKDIEAELLKFIKDKINKPGLEVYRVTANSATRIEYNFSSPNKIKETPCN